MAKTEMDNAQPEPSDIVLTVTKGEVSKYPALMLEGEDALRFLDGTGSGWIRDEMEDWKTVIA